MMDKMPDRISDEVLSNDPQDAVEAVHKQYVVIMPVTGYAYVSCTKESEEAAKEYALNNRQEWNVTDLDTDSTNAEVEEIN